MERLASSRDARKTSFSSKGKTETRIKILSPKILTYSCFLSKLGLAVECRGRIFEIADDSYRESADSVVAESSSPKKEPLMLSSLVNSQSEENSIESLSSFLKLGQNGTPPKNFETCTSLQQNFACNLSQPKQKYDAERLRHFEYLKQLEQWHKVNSATARIQASKKTLMTNIHNGIGQPVIFFIFTFKKREDKSNNCSQKSCPIF